jgi:aryl-alcohol dehydrogenase-like predicted oxidoreductase
MSLTQYRSLGRSGLAVSPLALGTMTFGTARWGSGPEVSRAVFDAYVEAGGNFIDTADVYASGRSEELLGSFIAERKLRDDLVIASKAGFASGSGVQRGGIGAKHLHAALEGSLRRLQTDYVDLYWVHVWDSITPATELVETMSTLIRSGKARYWGLSNAPAWFVAQAATLASERGLPMPIALQYFYSLVNRDVEDEHVPLASDLGMALVPWSPLAYGLLSGKYDRKSVERAGPREAGLPREVANDAIPRAPDDKRLDGANPFGDTLFSEKNWQIVEVVNQIARETGQSAARVSLAWVVGRPQVASTLMGVSRVDQVQDNVGALEFELSVEQRQTLDAVSALPTRLLYSLFSPSMRRHAVFGGAQVRTWAEQRSRS